MSLVEVLPSINSLSRVEKLRLIQPLAEELAAGEGSSGILANQSYPVWSPDQGSSLPLWKFRGGLLSPPYAAFFCGASAPSRRAS